MNHLETDIEPVVQQAMQTWNVPGLAISVVKDDQVLLAKGYGVRESGRPEAVDEHTLFAIGSNTKAFTATAIGLLVQEGQLAWDNPVRRYLPGFQLMDEHATQLMTVRDLLCHRSGLGTWAGDVLLLSSYSTEEIVRRLRHIPPVFSFRAGYGYSNLMFITAGLVIETVSGMSWDEFIRQRIFEPLGMQDSVTNPRYFGERANIAAPHEDVRGGLQTVPYRSDAHVGAAGAICASAADIALWLRLQLGMGSFSGNQLVDASIIEEMRTPHTPIRLNANERKLFPTRFFSAYGLGWFLCDTHGRLTVRHTGGVDGMLSSIVMLPEEKIGIAVFSNKLPNAAFNLLAFHMADHLLGASPRDWIQAYLELDQEGKEKEQQVQTQRNESRAQGTWPSFELAKYCGSYDSLILGGAAVTLADGGLHIQLKAHESISGKLSHWHYDTFLCRWDDPVLGESLVPFISDGQGNISEFRVKIREDWIDPIEHSFTKVI